MTYPSCSGNAGDTTGPVKFLVAVPFTAVSLEIDIGRENIGSANGTGK